jgi:THO complex subunit 2
MNLDSMDAADTVTSFVHSLITSTMRSFSQGLLSTEKASTFLQKLSGSLPSSSASVTPFLAALNECILDAIWSIDAEIEDKEYYLTLLSSQADSSTEGIQQTLALDRLKLTEFVKQLMVGNSVLNTYK